MSSNPIPNPNPNRGPGPGPGPITIDTLRDTDRAAWGRLALGYKTFYETTLPAAFRLKKPFTLKSVKTIVSFATGKQ